MEVVDFKVKALRKVSITPQMAAEWLEHRNTINPRKLMPSHVSYLAKIMREKNWMQDHPVPITFNEDGNILDGQNRLAAIAQIGIAVTMSIYTGCPSIVSEHIDSGVSRQMYYRVNLTGAITSNKHNVETVNSAIILNSKTKKDVRQTPMRIHEVFNLNKSGFLFGSSVMLHKLHGVRTATCAVALSEYFAISPAKATAFKIGLMAPVTDIESAQYLRNKLSGDRMEKFERYYWCVFCMNAHLNNTSVVGKFFRKSPDWGDYQPMIDTFYQNC